MEMGETIGARAPDGGGPAARHTGEDQTLGVSSTPKV